MNKVTYEELSNRLSTVKRKIEIVQAIQMHQDDRFNSKELKSYRCSYCRTLQAEKKRIHDEIHKKADAIENTRFVFALYHSNISLSES